MGHSTLPTPHPCWAEGHPFPDPTPSAPTTPQLHAFSAASTLSATWPRHLGGLTPFPHCKNPGYVPAYHGLAILPQSIVHK